MIATQTSARKKRKLEKGIAVLIILAVLGGWYGWYKFFREEAQPDWIRKDPEMRFKYGSFGAEREAGIPYWIFVVLPRMFPEYPIPAAWPDSAWRGSRARSCRSGSRR